MAQFFAGLKSRNEATRLRSARDLQKYVSTELRELPAERSSEVLDDVNANIFSLISSQEVHEKKGGILAIGEEKTPATHTHTQLVHTHPFLSLSIPPSPSPSLYLFPLSPLSPSPTPFYPGYTVSLVGLEGGGNVAKLGRYANYLRSILPHADVTLTEMTAKAIGKHTAHSISLAFLSSLLFLSPPQFLWCTQLLLLSHLQVSWPWPRERTLQSMWSLK